MLQLIFPFIVVVVICLLCGDVAYSKLLLSTSTLGGFGECIGAAGLMDSLFSASSVNLTAGDSIDWITAPMTSDDLLLLLNAEYFRHSKERFAGVVVGDYIQWMRSDILVPSSSIETPILDSYDSLINVQTETCSREPTAIICQSNISMALVGNDSALKISTVDYLQSNLTILLNTTSDHLAPMYFKELLASVDPSSVEKEKHQESYTLYSYPLQTISHANTALLLRGFVVANMIILYLLLTSIASVKSIVNFRGDGTKHQV